MNIIKIRGASLSFDNNIIFHSIDLDVEGSSIILLTGASGSGKTSFLRILSGSIPRIFKGSVGGFFQPSLKEIYRKVFYMSQEPWFGIATPYVWSEIFSTGSSEKDPMNYKNFLKELGLLHLYNRSTYTLSAGETQRLLLLKAFLSKKDLLLLDEPTSYLDKDNAELYAETLYKFSLKNNLSIIITDHRIDLWKKYTDQIYVFENRSIVKYESSFYKDVYNNFLEKLRSLSKERSVDKKRRCISFKIKYFKYPGSERILLKELEGSICEGEIILVKGVSGSGKSTFLKLLIERIVNSRYKDLVEVCYENIDEDFVRRNIIYVPDNPFLFFTEPIVEEELRGEVELLKKLNIDVEKKFLSIKRLSSGERRRVAFLSAIGMKRRFVFIDEPTVGLDPFNKYLMLRLMREYAEKGFTFIISSHDPHVEAVSDEIIYIR
jgi:energy-coupling factor transport system ATP-binding protein